MEEAPSEPQLYEGRINFSEKSEVLIHKESESLRNNHCSSWFSKINITIEPAICAMFLALNLCDIVITNLIMERTCRIELHLNKSECNLLGNDTDEGHRVEALVQPYASILLTAKSLLSSVLPAVLSVFCGPWSDSNGRKFLLLLPMLGSSISYLCYAILSYFSNLRPEYFLLASLPFSFSGGFINLISAAYAYISDITSEENRGFRLGLLETSLFVGVLIGVLSSYQIYKMNTIFGYTVVLSVGALITLVAFFYTMFFVRESIHRTQDSPNGGSLFQMKFVKETFVASFKRRPNHGRTLICISLVVMTVIIVVMEGESNLLYLFTRFRFGWHYPEFMTWSSVYVACHFVGLMVGCVLLMKLFKISDIVLVLASFFMKVVQAVFYGLIPAKSSYLMYWAQVVGVLGGVAGPALRSVVSKLIPKEDIGKVFFLATSFESLFPLIVTPIYTALYNLTIKAFPGAFFFFSASLYSLNFVLCSIIYVLQKRLASANYRLMNEESH